ncbi:perlucin-like protein [Paramacrobiotus metropolitanus]|uniref:perlucin-like protein n=1 Tax=Paramacrobiotus metropolitanus TaxID=2943436 RepID=UPI002445B42E|nr:perlucin-like protein [Paramacrobiotus metropolitanus]
MASRLYIAAIFIIAAAFQSANAASCPTGWQAFGNSCYYFGTNFNGMTWYDGSAFCQAFRAHLVELNDQAEHDFVQNKVKALSWSDGPWVGMVRVSPGTNWVLSSTRSSKSNDNSYNQRMDGLAKASSHDCGGFDRRGNIGFWRCRNGGSPICEFEA